jgi:SAM-dependent methyltransferase
MSHLEQDTVFAGSIPELYDTYFVPLIFEPYADEVARRVGSSGPSRVLETAAGTGILTRALARSLPEGTEIVATDLNPAMLERAAAVGTSRPVRWQQADAMQLPFDDASFDVVACQFGVMFFPDKAGAFAEVRRVLRPGGRLVFAVWDRIEDNELAHVVTLALAQRFADDPPRFMARTPHGYFDRDTIVRDLARGGFDAPPTIETLPGRSRAPSARVAAMAYCQGSPLRNEIESRLPGGLAEATALCTSAIALRFGEGPIDALMQAHLVSVAR